MQELDTKKRKPASSDLANAQRRGVPAHNEEVELVLAAKRGDGQAFEILIERYRLRILAVARRFSRV
jgi:hypothetical protein